MANTQSIEEILRNQLASINMRPPQARNPSGTKFQGGMVGYSPNPGIATNRSNNPMMQNRSGIAGSMRANQGIQSRQNQAMATQGVVSGINRQIQGMRGSGETATNAIAREALLNRSRVTDLQAELSTSNPVFGGLTKADRKARQQELRTRLAMDKNLSSLAAKGDINQANIAEQGRQADQATGLGYAQLGEQQRSNTSRDALAQQVAQEGRRSNIAQEGLSGQRNQANLLSGLLTGLVGIRGQDVQEGLGQDRIDLGRDRLTQEQNQFELSTEAGLRSTLAKMQSGDQQARREGAIELLTAVAENPSLIKSTDRKVAAEDMMSLLDQVYGGSEQPTQSRASLSPSAEGKWRGMGLDKDDIRILEAGKETPSNLKTAARQLGMTPKQMVNLLR